MNEARLDNARIKRLHRSFVGTFELAPLVRRNVGLQNDHHHSHIILPYDSDNPFLSVIRQAEF